MTVLAEGFSVGHWTHPVTPTGCTVVIPPSGNVASCDIRGSSPGSRELAQLHPDRRLTEIHGLVLCGGSAFGLAAAGGVVSWLEERGIGYRTPVATIPIVPAAVIFDRAAGMPEARPGPEAGRAACDAAAEDAPTGRVGAGAGATVGKWAGLEHGVAGGLGIASCSADDLRVGALAVVNSVGDVIGDDGGVLAGTTAPEPRFQRSLPPEERDVPMNTVLAVIALRANVDKMGARWLAGRGSDGITVSVRPAHTRYDGDVTFAVAAPDPEGREPDLDVLGLLATDAVAAAVRAAVAPASSGR